MGRRPAENKWKKEGKDGNRGNTKMKSNPRNGKAGEIRERR
jgi:hypothetical protein